MAMWEGENTLPTAEGFQIFPASISAKYTCRNSLAMYLWITFGVNMAMWEGENTLPTAEGFQIFPASISAKYLSGNNFNIYWDSDIVFAADGLQIFGSAGCKVCRGKQSEPLPRASDN